MIFPSIKIDNIEMIGEETVAIFNHIPLSKQTVSRRIYDIAEDVEEKGVSALQNTKFAV